MQRRESNSCNRAVPLSRRSWLKLSTAGLVSLHGCTWLEALAEEIADHPQRKRQCILLWMPGGPSQIDTFDMKPNHENGGEFSEVATCVPGLRISEHLAPLAAHMNDFALIRSMKTREGDHGRAMHLVRTGRVPQGPLRFPALGSMLSKELAGQRADLPDYVSIAPNARLNPAAFSSGFLGPRYAPLEVGRVNYDAADSKEGSLGVQNLQLPDAMTVARADARQGLLGVLESGFRTTHPDRSVDAHRSAYQRAASMMRGRAPQIFDLRNEPDAVRDRYGRHPFGQGCLLARRLVENGVPFVEVSLNGYQGSAAFGWDTHQNNFAATRQLCEILAPAWAALMHDLKEHGLLDSTLVVWMGEFGRTPRINGAAGRDHFPAAWSTVLAGGGIRGGQAIGRTTADGMQVEDRPVAVPDLLATICTALGVDPTRHNMSDIGRPIRLVDLEANVLDDVVARS